MTPARLLLSLVLAASTVAVQAQQGVDLLNPNTSPNFPGWTLYGSATAQNFTPGNGFTYSTLDLTQAPVGGQAGAGWAPQALALDFNAAFSFSFAFNVHNDAGELRGDGLTFVLADATGLGGAGSGLGYDGLSSRSVAFGVDTFHFDGQPVSPSLQILSGGGITPLAVTETGLGDAIRNGRFALIATVGYTPSGNGDNAGTLMGTIWNPDVGSFSVQAQVDFAGLDMVGLPIFYGFTASSGAATDGHTIQWGAPAAVPEPGNWALILAGLGWLASLARRRSARRS